MNRWAALIVSLLALLLGLAGYVYFARTSAPFGMFEGAGQSGVWRLVLSFGATVCGVILGSIYRALRKLQDSEVLMIRNIAEFIDNMLRSVDLWLGLAGSPLVYALLLKSSDGMSLSGLITVALENGFCCLLIINGFIATKGAPAGGAA